MKDKLDLHVEGHLTITDVDSGEVLLDKRNAIHREHMSILIASAIGNREDNKSIYSMHFGTGGATIDPLGNITYSTPNTTGAADLNVPVYYEVVDDNDGASDGNQIAVKHTNGTLFSDVEVRCIIEKNQPFGQAAFDNVGGSSINNSSFVFDEIGLKTKNGILLTHVVFSPIEKSANRVIEVIYTIRVSINN